MKRIRKKTFQLLLIIITIAVNAIVLSITIPISEPSNKLLMMITLHPYASVIFTFVFSNILLSILLHLLELLFKKNIVDRIYINKEFEDFVSDARSLFIIAGDLDFLFESPKQQQKFITLGENCKILHNNSPNTELQKIVLKLAKNNVCMKNFTTSGRISALNGLRGQIKENSNGYLKLLLVTKIEKKEHVYNHISIENGYVVEIIKDEFEKEFRRR